MNEKTQKSSDEIGKIKVRSDFLPSQKDLIKKDDIIKIFIPDRSYDSQKPDPENAAQEHKKELELKLNQLLQGLDDIKTGQLTEANIGAGADWPAFLIEITPYISTAGVLALFFSGKKIDENIDAWVSIALKISLAIKETGGYLNRAGAFLFSLAKLQEKKIGTPLSVQILEYQTLDSRFERNWKKINPEKTHKIANETPHEAVGNTVHYFIISINEQKFEVIVYGSEIEISKI